MYLPHAAAAKRESLSEQRDLCVNKMTEVPGFVYEQLHTDSFIEVYIS